MIGKKTLKKQNHDTSGSNSIKVEAALFLPKQHPKKIHKTHIYHLLLRTVIPLPKNNTSLTGIFLKLFLSSQMTTLKSNFLRALTFPRPPTPSPQRLLRSWTALPRAGPRYTLTNTPTFGQ